MSAVIPVVLFAYARPRKLRRVLDCLRENQVPLIFAFADGAKGSADVEAVSEVRTLLRAVDWCELRLVERDANLGLGQNILTGVTQVAATHDVFLVWEDDLICVPGTYAWLTAALRHYAADARVMSVSGWTHPRITPEGAGQEPYFDGRADCWVWGTWGRAWLGMEAETALEKMAVAKRGGVSPEAYGADLPVMARQEAERNTWAVRWLYHHVQHGGLCLRPPWSMVEHIGFDAGATNASDSQQWSDLPLQPAPPVPAHWPRAVEHPRCRELWQVAYPAVPFPVRIRRKFSRELRTLFKTMIPASVNTRLRPAFGWRWFRGDYRSWTEARAASGGYEDQSIVQKVLAATLEVTAGRAAFERDSVLFAHPEPDVPLLTFLQYLAAQNGGRLSVLDFGGSLGSNYWRHRTQLPAGDNLRWDVVEQAAFVDAGRRHLKDTPVVFHDNVQAAQAIGAHDVLLCSGVLQYLDEPFRFVEEWSRLKISYLLLNNLPLHDRGPDRLRVQHVPPNIYSATYPVWFFNRGEFRRKVGAYFDIMKEFDAEARWPVGWSMLQSTGMLLKRRIAP